MAKYVPYQESYDNLLNCDKWAKRTMWISTGLAGILFGLEFVQTKPEWLEWLTKSVTILNCIAILAFAVLDIYIRITFQRVRYNKRLDLLDNSFGTTFLNENSEEYYSNNELNNSLYKLAVNCFESNFFTVKIAKKMKRELIIKLAAVCIVFIATAPLGDKWFVQFLQLSLPVLLATDYIKHHYFVEDTNRNLLEFQSLFTSIKGRYNSTDSYKDLHVEAQLCKLIVNYESSIAAAAILLDKKIYDDNNPQLTKEWNNMKVRYQIV